MKAMLAAAFGLLVSLSPALSPCTAQDKPAAEKKVKTVRLLTVGNSFSQNATRYLNDLTTSAGHVLIHQAAAVGGATMALHWDKAQAYEKDPKDKAGLYAGKSLKDLLGQGWDFVTIQQASIRSHDVASYRPYAAQLAGYIKKHAPQAELLLHQTWAYRSDDPRFRVAAPKPGEPATQEAMYQGLTSAYKTIAKELGVRRIPVGDAFHLADIDPMFAYKPDAKFDFKNAKQPALPDQTHSLHTGWRWAKQKDGKMGLSIDGHHASEAGQYLGACVFFEILFGESVVGNKFKPAGLDATYARFLQETAHQAVTKAAQDAKPSKQAGSIDWQEQAARDAKEDRTTIIYDGKKPDSMVCDTTLRAVPDGSWVLVMLAGGDKEPSPQNYTGITRSNDQGKTWSPLQALDVGFPRSGDTIGQGPTELMVHKGRCTLFFSTHAFTWGEKWKSWMMHSDDSCRTWSKPEPVPGRLANFTFIRNHIVTRDGRILVPFQHYLGPPSDAPIPEDRWKRLGHFVSNPRNGVLISSDGGKTWTEHGNIRLTDNDRYHGWAENNIVELADGRIGMIIRGDRLGGVLYYAESKDGGRTWPAFAGKTEVPNPGSKATLYPLGGDTVAILHNPNPKQRRPLALWVSFDGMKTWPYRRVLVEESCDGPNGRLNYPDGFVSQDGRYLHFAFDDNRHRAVYYGAKLPPHR